MHASKRTRVYRDHSISGEQFALVVQTSLGPNTAYTAVHRQAFPRRIGGIRFATKGSLLEVGHLSAAMTFKCAAALIPFDGEKSLVETPQGIPASPEDKVAIIAAHLDDLVEADAGATLGPDMYAGEDVMSQLGAVQRFGDHITGRSPQKGGLGIDSNGATAAGLAAAIARVSTQMPRSPRTAVVQGFGAVGGDIARRLHNAGIAVLAVSNATGTLVAYDGHQLDIDCLLGLRSAGTTGRYDDGELLRYSHTHSECRFYSDNRAQVFGVPCDIFVPAARTMVLAKADELHNAREENQECYCVEEFWSHASPMIIAEGANYPISIAAEEYLEGRGASVLTDYLVNMGGVVGCLFEWAFLPELLGDRRAHERVNALATQWTERVGRRNTDALLARGHLSGRQSGRLHAEANMMNMLGELTALSTRYDSREWIRAYIEHTLSAP